MNISSVGDATASMGIGGANQQDFRTRMQQSMAPVAQLFGMTSDQLMSAVQASGGTLSDYAASKGISNADLTTAIKQGLQDNAPNGVKPSDTQLTNLAQRIENHKPGAFPAGPPKTDASDSSSASAGISDLKADLDKLIADLKAAESTPTGSTTNSTSTTDSNTLLALLTSFDQHV